MIVIAIIAILASILLPALNKAWDKAKTTDCLGRVKQYSSALMLYSDGYRGFLAPRVSAPGNPGSMHGISAMMYSGVGLTAKIMTCPSVSNPGWYPRPWYGISVGGTWESKNGYVCKPGAGVDSGLPWDMGPTLGINGLFMLKLLPVRIADSRIRRLSDAVLLADSATGTDSPAFTGSGAGIITEFNGGWSDAREIMPRHNGGKACNVAFADGHAETVVGNGSTPKAVRASMKAGRLATSYLGGVQNEYSFTVKTEFPNYP